MLTDAMLDGTAEDSFSLGVTLFLSDFQKSEEVENFELSVPEVRVIPATPIKLDLPPKIGCVSDFLKSEEVENFELSVPEVRVIPATPIKLDSPPEIGCCNGIHDSQETSKDEEGLTKKIEELKECLHQSDSLLQRKVCENNEKDEEIKRLEKIVADLENKERDFNDSNVIEKIKNIQVDNEGLNLLLEKQKSIKEELPKMMKEYEDTIAQLIAGKEEKLLEYQKDIEKMSKERNNAISHLNNLQVAFQDVHLKYEKNKSTIEQMVNNENAMKISLKEHVKKFENKNKLYEKLKIHANGKLAVANEEIENLKKFNENEILKLNTQIRAAELKMKSLEEDLKRKTTEVKELNNICKDLCYK